MFYSWQILARGGPLQVVWLAAHTDPKKLERQKVVSASIPNSIDSILHHQDPAKRLTKAGGRGFAASHALGSASSMQGRGEDGRDGIDTAPLALRLSGQLLLGVVRVYSKKASLLEGDLEATLERLQHEVEAPVLHAHGDYAAAVAQEARGGNKREKGAGEVVLAEGLASGAMGGRGEDRGAGLRPAEGTEEEGTDKVHSKGTRGRRAHQGAGVEGEVQAWMAELAVAEEEEVFLRRCSGGFAGSGSQGVADSSQLGHTLVPHSVGPRLQPLWRAGSQAFGQLQSLPPAGAHSKADLQQGQQGRGSGGGNAGGAGMEAADEVFDDGGLEFDLHDHEAALLTQPSADPSGVATERNRLLHGHLAASAGRAARECLIDGQGCLGSKGGVLPKEQQLCAGQEAKQAGDVLGIEDDMGALLEGKEGGDMMATPQLPVALSHEAPVAGVAARHHGLTAATPRSAAAAAAAPATDIHVASADGDIADTQEYAAGEACGGMCQDGTDPECLPPSTLAGTGRTMEAARAQGRSGSARCLLPLFTSTHANQGSEQQQQQQQQQQPEAHMPLPENCPHTKLRLRRVRLDLQSGAGMGGFKVDPQGRVVNVIELSSSSIKQLMRDRSPLLNSCRQERCNLHTVFQRSKAPTDLPYRPPSATDTPLLLSPLPSRLPPPSPFASPDAPKATKPAIPSEVLAVPELAFALHEAGVCSPSHMVQELRWLYYSALGWGQGPSAGQVQQLPGASTEPKATLQRAKGAREKPLVRAGVQQGDGGSQEPEQQQQQQQVGACGLLHHVQQQEEQAGGCMLAGLEAQGHGPLKPAAHELELEEGLQLFEGDEYGQDSPNRGNQGHDAWIPGQFLPLGGHREGAAVLDGFTPRTHNLLLRLQLLLLGEGDSDGKDRLADLVRSPTKKRRLQQQQQQQQQQEEGRGRSCEVLVSRDLLAEQLEAAAQSPLASKGGRSLRANRRNSAGGPGSLTPSHRMCAARTFHDLLVLQTGGYVHLQQQDSYADLCVLGGRKLARLQPVQQQEAGL